MKYARKKSHGYTLVELIVAITIFGIIITIGYEAMTTSITYNRKTEKMREIQYEIREIIHFISQDIKDPNLKRIAISPTGTRLYLEYNNGTSNEYNFNTSGNINYSRDGTSHILNSRYIKFEKIGTQIVFSPETPDANFVTINLQALSTQGTQVYKIPISTTISK